MKTSTFMLRAPRDGDVSGIVALQAIADEHAGDGWTTTAENVRHEWEAPGFERDEMVRVADADGAIVGLFTLYRRSENIARGGGFVHPDERGRGIGSALLGWGLDAARARGVRTLFTHSDEADSYSLFEQAGFTYARTFLRMTNQDPAGVAAPEWPDGIRLVSLQDQELVTAVADALDGSFIDHWNFTPTDREELGHELEDPGEDPALWFVAMGGDQVAGCNLCHLKTREGVTRGILGPIGTTRPFRGIGLGRALLRHGVLEMAARGAVAVSLGVDSINPNGALGLYERNGFTRASELRVFSIDL